MSDRSGFISSGSARGEKHPVATVGRIRQKDVTRGTWVRRTKSEGRSFNSRRKYDRAKVMRISAALGVGSVAVIIGAFLLWASKHRDVQTSKSGPITLFRGDPNAPEIKPIPVEEALLYVNSALSASTVDEVQQLFHLGSSSPNEVLSFLKDNVVHPPSKCANFWIGPIITDGLHIELGIIDLGNGQPANHRYVILAPDDKMGWKLDFSSLARRTSPSWDQILANPKKGGIVRICLAKDVYFNGIFEEGEWECYRLISPDVNQTIYGYCKPGSPAHKAILSLASKTVYKLDHINYDITSQMRTTLEIKAPEGAMDGQFEITRMIAEDWVARDTIYQDKF